MLKKRVTGLVSGGVAVVEIRQNVSGGSGFHKNATLLLNGTFNDAGYDYAKVDTYSLTSSGSVLVKQKQELIDALKGKYDLILALGAEAMHTLCKTKKTLDKYAGSLTWNKSVNSWVLPTYHPSVVYVGDRKTLNSRYDKFDILYDHIHRAVKLVTGKLQYPPKDGYTCDTEWIGHDGHCHSVDKRWNGYYEATDEEVGRAQEVFTAWLDLLDSCSVDENETSHTFAIDTESRNTNVFRSQAFLMLQVYDGRKAYAFNAGVLHHPQVEPLVKLFLMSGRARFALWNTKYDRQVIWHEFGVSLEERDVDGMVLAMGITEKGRQCGLKYRSRQDLNAPFYEEALDEYLNPDDIDYSMIPPHVLATYGCKDVYYTYHEIPLLLSRVKAEGTLKLCTDILMPAQRTLADVEYQGMNVDVEYAKAKSLEWEPVIEDAIREVQDYARDVGFPSADSGIGREYKSVCDCVPVRARFVYLEGARVLSYAKLLREAEVDLPSCKQCNNKRYVSRLDVTLNVNSPKQMQHLCYDILKMKKLPHEDDLTTNKFFWEFNGNHPLSKLVAKYKELQFLRRNFLEGMQRFVAEDGKVHPDFLLFGTKTGRLSVHDPAAQTFPAHSENGKVVKKTIIADEGCVIVNADYKSLEMFMAHHLTGDPKLLENLLGEWDIHTALAAVVYSKSPGDITPEERQSVKSVNFGAGYGISGFKLALDPAMEQATGGDPEVAQQFIDAFWSMYSVWSAKCDEWRAQAQDVQSLTTEMGRKRRWNLITKDNVNKVNNQAINFAGQSMASDLCLSSLVRIHTQLQARGWGRVLLTVHDSLVFNIRREVVHEAVELITQEMTTPPFETFTPFSIDVEVGPSYGETEPYDKEKVYT